MILVMLVMMDGDSGGCGVDGIRVCTQGECVYDDDDDDDLGQLSL